MEESCTHRLDHHRQGCATGLIESKNTAALNLQVCMPSVWQKGELEQAEEEITLFLS